MCTGREDGMERWIKRTVELATGIAFTGKANPSVIPYYPQKTEISAHETRYFPRTEPERKGVSSSRLLALLRAFEKDKSINVHTFLCLKDGEVICEAAQPGYEMGTWHLSHSMSKTVTGMAIGMLVDDGKLSLDDRLVDILPEYAYRDDKIAEITVRHLLTMTTGVRFAEAGSVTETNWTEAFFDSSCAFKPGTDFAYNSMNSYILARIVVKLTGESLTDFLDKRLFGPLHITNRFWEKSAEGIEKGGWGLYLSPESWAKIGYMMLLGGVFEGRRILSREWVSESHQRHAKAPESIGHFDYGYQMWASREDDGYLFNGMLGQNVWICPRNGIVAVMMSGNNELFQNSPARFAVEKYLGDDLSSDLSTGMDGDVADLRYAEKHFFERRHWIRPYAPKRGLAYRLGLKSVESYPREWDLLIGKYCFPKNNVGIVPLVVRAMQNNLWGGIDSIEFSREGDSVFFSYTEGGASYSLEIGFSSPKQTVIDFNGERYIARVMGEVMEDVDRNTVYKLEIIFPELPNTRMIKLSIEDDGRLTVRLSEMPNERIADVFLRELNGTNPKMSAYMSLIEKRIGKNTANKRMTDTFAPTLIGVRAGAENFDAVMDEESEKGRVKEKKSRWIDAIVDKLLRDGDEDTERGFIGDIVDRIKLRIPKKQKVIAEENLPQADKNTPSRDE